MPDLVTLTLENSERIRKRSTKIETEIDVARVNSYVEYAVSHTLRPAVSNRHGTVRVINILVTRRHFLKHKLAQSEGKILNRTIIWLEKLNQLSWYGMFSREPGSLHFIFQPTDWHRERFARRHPHSCAALSACYHCAGLQARHQPASSSLTTWSNCRLDLRSSESPGFRSRFPNEICLASPRKKLRTPRARALVSDRQPGRQHLQ